MSTFADRPHTALLVIDVQNGVVEGAHERDAVVANVATLVDKARSADVPVVWVQHNAEDLPIGSEEWAYVPELLQAETEPVVHKQFGDSFEQTDLEDVLSAAGVGHVVVAGAATDACIRSTIHGAVTRGYDVTLVGDAHTTGDLTSYGAPPPDAVIAHTNLYWKLPRGPRSHGGRRRDRRGELRLLIALRATIGGVRVEARSVGELVAHCEAGGHPRYVNFWGHQPQPDGSLGPSCLSQWWPARFAADGQVFASAEHYMMWRKARLFDDDATAAEVLATSRRRRPRSSDAR